MGADDEEIRLARGPRDHLVGHPLQQERGGAHPGAAGLGHHPVELLAGLAAGGGLEALVERGRHVALARQGQRGRRHDVDDRETPAVGLGHPDRRLQRGGRGSREISGVEDPAEAWHGAYLTMSPCRPSRRCVPCWGSSPTPSRVASSGRPIAAPTWCPPTPCPPATAARAPPPPPSTISSPPAPSPRCTAWPATRSSTSISATRWRCSTCGPTAPTGSRSWARTSTRASVRRWWYRATSGRAPGSCRAAAWPCSAPRSLPASTTRTTRRASAARCSPATPPPAI